MKEWEKEPDRLEWEYCGFKCLILRSDRMKHLCGYVGLPKWHPYYGKHYNQCLIGCTGEISDIPPLKRLGIPQYECTFDERDHPTLGRVISVHGGLTFSQEGDGERWEKGYWWIGFDRAHSGDLVPGMEEHYDPELTGYKPVYRNINYVINEVTRLAEQLTPTAIAERAFGGENEYWYWKKNSKGKSSAALEEAILWLFEHTS